MKKTLSIILTFVMMLSMFTCLILPSSAKELGNWDVKLSAEDEEKFNADPTDIELPRLPGYKYTDEGFMFHHTIMITTVKSQNFPWYQGKNTALIIFP